MEDLEQLSNDELADTLVPLVQAHGSFQSALAALGVEPASNGPCAQYQRIRNRLMRSGHWRRIILARYDRPICPVI